ncbi:MAG: universal stress protein [Desulfobaccales bacterium]
MPPTLPCPFALDNILVCTDDSPASQGALKAAIDLARVCGSRISLLFVLEFIPPSDFSQPDALGMIPGVGQDFLELREQAARKHREGIKQEAAGQGVAMEIRLRTGSPIHAEILAAADEIKPRLIVMGRRGRSGLERLLVGSVTARVIGHTPCPVLVVPRNAVLSFNKPLVASDGSPAGQAACQTALELARRTGGKLTAVTAAHGDLDPKRAKALVRDLAAAAKELDLDFDPLTPGGRPEDAIIEVAAAKHADLIIMGSHGRTGLKRLFLGSVAERVMGQAACPVLVVKGPE